MFGEIFYWVFNMSIIATFMGLPVMLIRRIRAIPHRVSVFLWIVPFVRMCIPFGINNPYSLMTLVSRLTTRTVTVYQMEEGLSVSASNVIMAADSYFPLTYKTFALEIVFRAAGLVWIIISLAILIALTVLYLTTKREVRDARCLKGNVFLSERVGSPAVYGVFRPRIVLPASCEDRDLRYVLQHERAHIRGRDNLWRLLAFFAAAIHWFNPFSWVFLKVFLSDLELACDERAVAGYEGEERKEYARSLLDYASGKNLFVSAFGGAKVRTRIENVLSYRHMTMITAVGFAILILAIIITLLTNAG